MKNLNTKESRFHYPATTMIKKNGNKWRNGLLSAMLVAIVMLACSGPMLLAKESTLKGYFLIDGEWKKGTLNGDGISINSDIATAEPPCTLKTDDGKYNKSRDENVIITVYNSVEESQDIANHSESYIALVETIYRTSANNSTAMIFATNVYHNPKDKSINTSFNLDNTSNVRIILYDKTDKELYEIYNDITTPGKHTKTFSIETLPTGMYYVRFVSNNNIITEQFTVQ